MSRYLLTSAWLDIWLTQLTRRLHSCLQMNGSIFSLTIKGISDEWSSSILEAQSSRLAWGIVSNRKVAHFISKKKNLDGFYNGFRMSILNPKIGHSCHLWMGGLPAGKGGGTLSWYCLPFLTGCQAREQLGHPFNLRDIHVLRVIFYS